MKMAIAIQCHSNSEHINRLIEFFKDEEIDIYLHIDKKSNIVNSINYLNNKNVNIVDDPIDVKWGDFSQIKATLKLFKKIKSKDIYYDYIHLISGSDYPIKSLNQFKYFFTNNKQQYINCGQLPNKYLTKGGLDRYKVFYPSWMIDRPANKIKRFIRICYRELILNTRLLMRNTKHLGKVCYGSQWFSITGECMDFILHFVEENKRFCDFFKNSIYPDEMFFQTIIMNSDFNNRVENNNLRYIDWTEKKASPKELDIEDISKAIISDSYFARKINNMEVIDYIENIIKSDYYIEI